MGRLSQLIDSIQSALDSVGLSFPPWILPVIGVAIVAAIFPMFVRSSNSVRARGILSRSRFVTGEDRIAMEREAMEMVQGDPEGLVVVATVSVQQGRENLAREALEQLKQTGKHRDKVRQIELALDGPPPISPEAEVIAIRNLLGNGLVARARERMERARRYYPDDSDLDALDKQIQSGDGVVPGAFPPAEI